MEEDKEVIELAIKYAFSYEDIKQFKTYYDLNNQELESIVKSAHKGKFSLDAVREVLDNYQPKQPINMNEAGNALRNVIDKIKQG